MSVNIAIAAEINPRPAIIRAAVKTARKIWTVAEPVIGAAVVTGVASVMSNRNVEFCGNGRIEHG